MMQIIDCIQGDEAWFKARAGIPTASQFATVMASGKDGGASKTRKTYMLKLAGEIMTGEPMKSYSNDDMEDGKRLEPEARNAYAFMKEVDPQLVGFIVNGPKGCSPDSLIGSNGVLEIKRASPHVLIEIFLADRFPAHHKAQCQGNLWVTEREWIDIAVYWPKLPLFIKRAHRDEDYIREMADAVDKFNNELTDVLHRMRAFGGVIE